MFFQPSNLQSTSIRNIMINADTQQVIVQYLNNAKTYLYDNVSFKGISEYILGETTSAGKFVNDYCKGSTLTVVGWLTNTYVTTGVYIICALYPSYSIHHDYYCF